MIARVAWVSLLLLGSTGCALIGPASIRAGRPAYNDTIVATNNQQILAMIVRMRYGEPSGLLAVSSITANMKIQSSAGAEFGFGEKTNYQGNLVPLSIGFAYEENPTISYTPIQGERYMRQLLSPVPVDLTLLLLQALRDTPLGLTLLVRSINGIGNPDFLADPSLGVDARFTRLTELLSEMGRQGRITWTQASSTTPAFHLAVTGEGKTFDAQVGELHELLGFSPPADPDGVILLPVQLGFGVPDEPSLHIQTRSLYDLFSIVAASVDVPEDHKASGIAPPLPPVGHAGQSIRIRRTKRRPDEAIAEVRHHGWWYSIDGADPASKTTFRIVEALLSVRIADTVNHRRSTPVLTVPVAR